MSTPPIGCPIGLEVGAKDVARGSAFYSAVFNWKFGPSDLGAPAHKLLTFTVPGSLFPAGCILHLADDPATGMGTTKLYLYVDDMATAMQSIEEHGGKKTSEVMPEGSKGFFQMFEDTEGNNSAIYSYAK